MKACNVAEQVNESCENLVDAIAQWHAGSPEAIEICCERLQKAVDLLARAQAAAVVSPESARGAAEHLGRIKELAGFLQSRTSLATTILSLRLGVRSESSLFYKPGGLEEILVPAGSAIRGNVRIEA
jgi:hypothetical protein